MYLSDNDILNEVEQGRLKISPFCPKQIRQVDNQPVLSFGTSPAGYDVRLQHEWKVFVNPNVVPRPDPIRNIIDELCCNDIHHDNRIIDPLNFDQSLVKIITGPELILGPGQYALASTLEEFEIPNNIMGTWMAKSTYARCGLIFNTTPVQPGFKGNVVMEFFNATQHPMLIRADHGFAQVIFGYTKTPCISDYSVQGGYQGQTGVQLPKV